MLYKRDEHAGEGRKKHFRDTFLARKLWLELPQLSVVHTISLKALSRAPMTKHSCGIFFSVKKRVGGVLGEPGAPTPPRSEAARVRVLPWAGVLSGSSPRQVGGRMAEFFRISTISCS